MVRIQFNNRDYRTTAEFKIVGDDCVQLTGKEIEKNTSGFKVYRMNGDFLGEYSDYTDIVTINPGCIILRRKTNDSSR